MSAESGVADLKSFTMLFWLQEYSSAFAKRFLKRPTDSKNIN